MATPTNHVHEMQGLYGPFTIAERVVQKIWLRRDFAIHDATLVDGRKLEIRSPGAWNLLGGPDFRGARLRLGDGVEVTGDIEVHFHASDWRAHAHEADRAYDRVVLHVVMFPPSAGERPAVRGDGSELPTLVLLPLLHRSLEEYASDDALENITERDATERIAELLKLPEGELRRILLKKAGERWSQKRRFAALRIEKLGWSAAAHQTALEILGYRLNRAAMLAVAASQPLEAWVAGLDVDAVFGDRVGQWQLQGVRPANHPRLRLLQYRAWVEQRPDWPEVLGQIVPTAGAGIAPASETLQARKQLAMADLREKFSRELMGGAIGGSRLDTLVCDGLLPLAAIKSGRDLSPTWFHWYLGDVPAEIRRALRETGIAGQSATPFCHGWGQGLLGWLLEREARASG
ncbi:MAG TPA: DUF2851 family protein [Lacunisphaera sp.]|nr:DUF2851 family protein [Lacunisphaera sp.]